MIQARSLPRELFTAEQATAMSRAFDDSRYLARTLAASMLELDPEDQRAIVAFFRDELRRLSVPDYQAAPPPAQDRCSQPHAAADQDGVARPSN